MDTDLKGITDEIKDQSKEIIHEFKGMDSTKKMITKATLILFIGAAVLGIATGYIISKKAPAVTSMTTSTGSSTSNSSNQVEGSNDLTTFKDTAQGTLQTGGIDGEGQYHLVRPGGDSQNVYMVSSVVDLSKYVGKNVKVWGQTQQSQKAGWLMDVGRIQAL